MTDENILGFLLIGFGLTCILLMIGYLWSQDLRDTLKDD